MIKYRQTVMTSVITEPIQKGLNDLAAACDQLSSAIKTQQKKGPTSVVIAEPTNASNADQASENSKALIKEQEKSDLLDSEVDQVVKGDKAADLVVEDPAAAPVVEDQAANQAVEADSEANTAAAPSNEQAAAPFPKPPPSGEGGTRKPRMHKRKKTQRKRSKTIKKKNKAGKRK